MISVSQEHLTWLVFIDFAVDPFVDKPPILCSNPTSCLPSTQPSIEVLVSAGFASGVFIAILPTAIICYYYWKKRGKCFLYTNHVFTRY